MHNVKILSKYTTRYITKKGPFKKGLWKTFQILAKFGSLLSVHTLLKCKNNCIGPITKVGIM